MRAREIAATIVVPVAIGVFPFILDKRGVTVPSGLITLGGVLAIGGLCFGLFHLLSWILDKQLSTRTLSVGDAISYVLAISIGVFLATWWVIGTPEHPLLSIEAPKQVSQPSPSSLAGNTQTATPKPRYIPERNDYVCPIGSTPAGGWGKDGVPTDPNRGIGCKREVN